MRQRRSNLIPADGSSWKGWSSSPIGSLPCSKGTRPSSTICLRQSVPPRKLVTTSTIGSGHGFHTYKRVSVSICTVWSSPDPQQDWLLKFTRVQPFSASWMEREMCRDMGVDPWRQKPKVRTSDWWYSTGRCLHHIARSLRLAHVVVRGLDHRPSQSRRLPDYRCGEGGVAPQVGAAEAEVRVSTCC